VQREDLIHTPYASLNFTFNKHLSAEIAYLYNQAESNVPAAAAPTGFGREFKRHYVSVGAKFAF
jgi:hypothetical protein